MKIKKRKKIDAVKMMRDIRDKFSEQFLKMTYEEQKQFILDRINVRKKKGMFRLNRDFASSFFTESSASLREHFNHKTFSRKDAKAQRNKRVSFCCKRSFVR